MQNPRSYSLLSDVPIERGQNLCRGAIGLSGLLNPTSLPSRYRNRSRYQGHESPRVVLGQAASLFRSESGKEDVDGMGMSFGRRMSSIVVNLKMIVPMIYISSTRKETRNFDVVGNSQNWKRDVG